MRSLLAAIGLTALSVACVDCTCGKTGAGRDPSAAFALPAVYELHEALAASDRIVVVGRAKDSKRLNAVALDTRGAKRWHSAAGSHVLLDATAAGPVVVVDPDGAGESDTSTTRHVAIVSAESGRVERTFTVERPRLIWDDWIRDGMTLIVVQQVHSDARATLAAVDAEQGRMLWTRDADVITDAGSSPQLAAAPIMTGAHVYLRCKTPDHARDYGYDLCRFSRVDGMLTKVFPGNVVDFARGGEILYVLREHAVDAVAPDGTAVWTKALPDDSRGARIVATSRWLAVMASFVRTRQDYDDRLFALDAKDGHELWTKWSGNGGGHFGSDLAIADDRLVYFGNLTPQMHIVDARGAPVFEGPIATRGVISTEVIGSFMDPIRGGPFLAPPFLAIAPGEHGLQFFRIP